AAEPAVHPEFNPYSDTEDSLSFTERLFGVAPDTGGAEEQEAQQVRLRKETIQALLSLIDVRREGISLVINVTAATRDPELSAQIANEFAQTYITTRLANRVEERSRVNTWLFDRLERLRERLQTAEANIANFRRENDLYQVMGESIVEKQILDLTSQLVDAEGRLAEAQSRLSQATELSGASSEEAEEADDIGVLEAFGDVLNSETINDLRGQRAAIVQRKAELRQRYGPRHPQFLAVDDNLAEIDAEIDAEVSRIIQSLETEAAIAVQRVASIDQRLEFLQAEQSEKIDAAVRLAELERQAAADRALYTSVLDMWNRSVEEAALDLTSSRVVSVASPALEPAFPNKKLLAVALMMLGAGIGMCAAFLVEALDTTFCWPEQLADETGMTDLGVMPHGSSKTWSSSIDQTSLTTDERRDVVSVRHVLHNLIRGDLKSSNVAGLFSARPEEGKSTLTNALARVARADGMT
ncbi:MAG: GumC family protein, partial [Pseudomonadota bacterium]